MKTGRPRKYKLELSSQERADLAVISGSRTMSAGLVRRAKLLLMTVDGLSDKAIAEELKVSLPTVSYWRLRYTQEGLAGLYDLPKSGRPRTHDDERVAGLLSKVVEKLPAGQTHWSVRSAAKHSGISKSSVHRYFSLFGVQPHRSKSFKLSNDPHFIEKVRDIVGLYLNPPANALVLCVDEKSQIQALERSQPILPMGLGYVEGVTHDYFRHGTTTLFAALDVHSGAVITRCKPRHRHQEFLSFLNHIEASVPAHLQLHLVIDNYATHKHPKVRAWLSAHPRYHLHFTPTYSSWLNQVERWFGLITQQAIRRGSFTNVRQLIQKIHSFVSNYNAHSRPFKWTATPESIFAKLERLSKVICGT